MKAAIVFTLGLLVAAVPLAAEAAPCVPSSSSALQVGVTYLQHGAEVNPGAGSRYVSEGAGVVLWAETNGLAGLQTSAAQTCGAPVDTIVVAADEGAFVDARSVNFGAHVCEANAAQPQGFCRVSGG